jgi:uncharacterized protein YjeT (DUF2065 family)
MSDMQIFQVFGLSISAMGLGMLMNPEYLKKVLRDFAQSPALTFLSGFMAILVGYLIIAFNSMWTGTDLIITIFGWLALIKGVMLILYPATLYRLARGILRKKENFTYASVFCLAFGIIFLYLGYLA